MHDVSLQNKLLTEHMTKHTIDVLIKKKTFSMWRYTAWMQTAPVVAETISFTSIDHIHIKNTTTARPAEDLRHRTHQPQRGSAPSARGVELSSWLEDGPSGDASCRCCGTTSACSTGVHCSSCASQALAPWPSRSERRWVRRWKRWPLRRRQRKLPPWTTPNWGSGGTQG